MRINWYNDHAYIVRLTKHIVGEQALAALIEKNKRACNPAVLHRFLAGIILPKIVKMNHATLGRICAYASSDGANCGKHFRNAVRPPFINRTGLNDVLTPSIEHYFTDMYVGQYLDQIAMAVISCVVVDMMFQDKWQAEWDSHEMTVEEEGEQPD